MKGMLRLQWVPYLASIVALCVDFEAPVGLEGLRCVIVEAFDRSVLDHTGGVGLRKEIETSVSLSELSDLISSELTLDDAFVDAMHEVTEFEALLPFESFSSLALFKLELGATNVYLSTGADVSMALVIGLLTVLASVVGLMH